MKCLFHFGITSMKEDTSTQLSGRGELHGRSRVIVKRSVFPCQKVSFSCYKEA